MALRSKIFYLGLPMVLEPKSEAWLICALKSNAYDNCAALEDSLSDNDKAPEPAKERLREVLKAMQRHQS